MSGAKIPAVRLPTVIAGQDVDEEGLGEDAVVVDLPASSKFGFAWPAEPPPPVPLPLTAERSAGTFSSSEGETDVSEEEFSVPAKRTSRTESDESEFVTPTGHMNSDQNPMDQQERPLAQPPLSRAFSMPLPSQLGPLQNPRRIASSPSNDQPPSSTGLSVDSARFHELSLELADSVQMVIQTLLQLSPPQILDPAKEQFAACSLSIPTPSISAMFTSMKNLNYMSANMSALTLDPPLQHTSGVDHTMAPNAFTEPNDFDVGEMLQSVGDALGGVAAQGGVDLVLYHGDVGVKHIAVRGNESGISYALSHVIRQVIGSAHRGDTIEVGLIIEEAHNMESPTPSVEAPFPSLDVEGPLRCVFRIYHKYFVPEAEHPTDTVSVESSNCAIPSVPLRSPPSLNTLFLRRLLRHVDADLEVDVAAGSFVGQTHELAMTLERGSPSVVDPAVDLQPEDAAYLGFQDVRIAHEPTLEHLIQFAETLRGRKVTLHAHSKGSFAQHLTSYMTSWGLDVSHVSTELGAEGSDELAELSPDLGTAASFGRDGTQSSEASEPLQPATPVSITLIDDSVAVLRSRLQKLRTEHTAYPLNLPARKRPSLASNHRPRSSPQVARVMGYTAPPVQPAPPVVIIHFTSLSNFKLVKDAVQSVFVPGPGPAFRIPEVIVIPKPAGPRRLLTALHTAITKPVVDPFFSPIATSPMSPGYHLPLFNMGTVPKSPGARSTTSMRTTSDRSAWSPKESSGDSTGYAPSSPRGMPEGMEYFSDAAFVDAASRLGSSPASGLVIQSPDGQPAGIFFHPKAKMPRTGAAPPPTERERGQYAHPGARTRGVSFRRSSGNDEVALTPGGQESARRSPRPLTTITVPDIPDVRDLHEAVPSKGKVRQMPISEEIPPMTAGPSSSASTVASSPGERPMSPPVRVPVRMAAQNDVAAHHGTDPPSPHSPSAPHPVPRRQRRPKPDAVASAPVITQKKGKLTADGNIVPPISVLIVDDNPINQTILSTFMGKKKIKYDVAKNGEEAVQKWRSGSFHLILASHLIPMLPSMDIQMPVMDGITATKEIRRIEKLTGATGFPSTPQSEGQRTPSEASTGGESRSSATSMTPPYRSSVIIVALTASSLQIDRVNALAAGCNDFLTKPVSLHWLNSKIIEWGSIKALQMWADIRPDVVKSISTGQAQQAQNVARRLHVPEGRSTPSASRSRSSSVTRKPMTADSAASAAIHLARADKTVIPTIVTHEVPPGVSAHSSDSVNVLESVPASSIRHDRKQRCFIGPDYTMKYVC
ncbi:hypothetical protein B0H21DRAFT_684507 [Amylocystis lapponica]|nr:hypothetical protein B0H21DRAFT_684507 [Amylocystis lapponica]